jgi:hypothetical protein
VIARPLDLASRLRAEPRGFDALFYVNVGLLCLFFDFFGSRFVLSPGLGVDFQVPRLAGAQAGASVTTCTIHVLRSGQIFTDNGLLNLGQLRPWLKLRYGQDVKNRREPTLLIIASEGLTLSGLADIQAAAHDAGFRVLLGAEEPGTRPGQVPERPGPADAFRK